ncbi:Crp/Fnr family transcriptional regulator [Bosea sp. SSUT16]|jgi:CRP-like cAMP-binding protein|uniref:Crp/Fnr family transcriptional regulator n=2 Tax=Boseaceae TaxID=2831100 RepID=A0A927E638_9HYPH|nr:Crp/Fnr family transcriptional regulator [Bosea spartocytisi]MBD3845481.1 Crp/Fnr family transcriptional regulator [Bosea spartocytisi]MCT4472652.1 Crp/Fnr family transcriptional regulator [Bosea spartocytisi]
MMNLNSRPGRIGTPCLACPLRMKPAFEDKTDDEIRFIQAMKTDHRSLKAGSDIISPDQESAELYTLFSGWAFRYKSLPDGRRQILNFLLPGDIVGLQASLLAAAQHGIEALTDVELCVFPRKRIWDLFVRMPNLAYELAWLGSREESMIDDNLTSVGQRNASERIAALVITLYRRADALGLVSDGSFDFPLSQQQLADALGLSLVHTSKTWSKLRKAGLFTISGGRLTLLNPRLTARMAAVYEQSKAPRPLI